MSFVIIFDEVILKQLRRFAKNNQLKQHISRMLDKIEQKGPLAGKLIDSQLFIYEMKQKHPPLRLYYRIIKETKGAYVFLFEMKKSDEQQQKTISRIRDRLS